MHQVNMCVPVSPPPQCRGRIVARPSQTITCVGYVGEPFNQIQIFQPVTQTHEVRQGILVAADNATDC